MRKDMHEVVTLRPRKGYMYPDRRIPEDATKVSMRRHLKYKRNFNDFLAPLARLLQKRVGRSWNKTYADICEGLSKSDVHRKHIKLHLRDMVLTAPVDIQRMMTGDVYYSRGFFYVEKGILRAAPRRRHNF